MPPTTRARHRAQFAAAIFVTVGAVFGLSRVVKGRSCAHSCPGKKPSAVTFVPAPPIVPRVDPPLQPAAGARPRVAPTLFLAAIREGDVAGLERMFDKGMVLDGTLAAAAATGRKPVVAWLLDHGADVHDGEGDGEAPILAADAYPEIVALLLERGAAEPDLAVAAIAGAPNAVTRQLAKRAPVNPKDGTTPLFDAVSSTVATTENKRLIVQKLLAAGADPNVGEPAQTPVVAAVATCESADDSPAQKVAVSCVTLIDMLGARGARVNGDALQAALALGDPLRDRVLDALLTHRLEPDATAAALAQASGELQLSGARKIAAHGVAWAWHDGEADAATPLLDAIDRLDVPLVRVMIEAGAPVDTHHKDGRSPLGLALDKASTSDGEGARIVDMLVSRGANVNRRLPDGRTPLFAAAENGDIRVVNAMLAHGARVNEIILDETALDAAERNGHLPVARILHAHGGRRQVKSSD